MRKYLESLLTAWDLGSRGVSDNVWPTKLPSSLVTLKLSFKAPIYLFSIVKIILTLYILKVQKIFYKFSFGQRRVSIQLFFIISLLLVVEDLCFLSMAIVQRTLTRPTLLCKVVRSIYKILAVKLDIVFVKYCLRLSCTFCFVVTMFLSAHQ